MRGKILLLILTILVGVAAIAWWQRAPLLARWHVSHLAAANDALRDARIHALAECGEDAIGPLLASLSATDADGCHNIELGLRGVTESWPADDPRILRTAEAISATFGSMSVEGKKAALRFAATLVGRDENVPLPATVSRTLGDLMINSEVVDILRPAALFLAGALVERGPTGQWQVTCRGLAIKGLGDHDVATRIAAIQLVLRDPLRKDHDLLAKVVPFLQDRDAGVRRVAVVALGSNVELVSEEQLLPLLHDADADIQRLTEMALQSRGLSEEHVRLARFISHADPAVRLQVIPLLRNATDLDADVWLRRLTLDPAPAVRAAAVRLASSDPSNDIRQRLGEMVRSDPSPTVREIARFYMERTTVRKVGN